jgi:hypothetical protein
VGGNGDEEDEVEESSDDERDANVGESMDKISNSISTALNGKGKPEEIMLPDELVVPLFCIFQNYLSICREANNKFLLGKMERVKRIIKALYDVMLEYELMPMQEKNTMPPFGAVDILLCGEVKQQLSETFEELKQVEEEEISQQDTDSEATRQELAEEREAGEEEVAAKQVELTPLQTQRSERLYWWGCRRYDRPVVPYRHHGRGERRSHAEKRARGQQGQARKAAQAGWRAA